MLNPFPELLTYSLFAPLILRCALAICFLAFAKALIGKRKEFPEGKAYLLILGTIAYIALGLLLIAGAFTQIAAIISIVLLIVSGIFSADKTPLCPRLLQNVLIAIALSLLLSGAGIPAFDLPL